MEVLAILAEFQRFVGPHLNDQIIAARQVVLREAECLADQSSGAVPGEREGTVSGITSEGANGGRSGSRRPGFAWGKRGLHM